MIKIMCILTWNCFDIFRRVKYSDICLQEKFSRDK